MKFTLIILSFFILLNHAKAGCFQALTIETDDSIYPGTGEVQVCTNAANEIEKLKIIKPVHNAAGPIPDSVQFDERNPIMNISIAEINKAQSPIVIMRPRRLKMEIQAASIMRYGKEFVSPISGGMVELRVLKSKVMGKYHALILSLKKINGSWVTTIRRSYEPDWMSVKGLFFETGVDGIKHIDIE